MNSKDWKIGLLALAAVSLLAACSNDNKKEKASPFTGIWILQENVEEYSTYSGRLRARDYNGFCDRVELRRDYYGDEEFRVSAILIQNTGEVYRYTPGASVSSPGFREENILGTVNAHGLFTRGRIGPDGRFMPNWGRPAGYGVLPAQATFTLEGRNSETVLRFFTQSGQVHHFQRSGKVIAEEYSVHVGHCLGRMREVHERRYGPRAPRGAGKDYDPRVVRPRAADPRAADPRLADPRFNDPRLAVPPEAEPEDEDLERRPPARRR